MKKYIRFFYLILRNQIKHTKSHLSNFEEYEKSIPLRKEQKIFNQNNIIYEISDHM